VTAIAARHTRPTNERSSSEVHLARVQATTQDTTVNPDLWELDQRYLELPGSAG
jgi:hypothetical protein